MEQQFFITQLNTKTLDTPMHSTGGNEALMMDININPYNQTECDLSQVTISEFLGKHYKASQIKLMVHAAAQEIRDITVKDHIAGQDKMLEKQTQNYK